jgi:hypothetical protein
MFTSYGARLHHHMQRLLGGGEDKGQMVVCTLLGMAEHQEEHRTRATSGGLLENCWQLCLEHFIQRADHESNCTKSSLTGGTDR